MTDAQDKPDLLRIIRELLNVRQDDRSLVMVSHGYAEILVNALATAKCKNERVANVSHSARLVILSELELIPDDLYESLYSLKRLRDRAAHQLLFKLTDSDWKNLKVQKKSKTAHGTFQQILLDLFNKHLDVFASTFLVPAMSEGWPNRRSHSPSPSDKDSNQPEE